MLRILTTCTFAALLLLGACGDSSDPEGQPDAGDSQTNGDGNDTTGVDSDPNLPEQTDRDCDEDIRACEGFNPDSGLPMDDLDAGTEDAGADDAG